MYLKNLDYLLLLLLLPFLAKGYSSTGYFTSTDGKSLVEIKTNEVLVENPTEINGFSEKSESLPPLDLAVIEGELKRFHKLTFTWDGVDATESEDTFMNYVLNVNFTSPSGKVYKVPGYFAADGNAGESSATSGNKWRCNFMALEAGNWSYQAFFRTGQNIAVNLNDAGGTAVAPIDGDTGTFTISETDKTGQDFRSKGKLEYVGEHFMQWTNGEYFLKVGSNSPETFLEFEGFDDTNDNRFYTEHISDWQTGDPTWKTDEGKGIIGAVNYLGGKGVNSQFMQLHNGREQGTPWLDPSTSYAIYDVSKLDQWQIVMDHMMTKGIMPHIVFSETTNQSLFEVNVPSGDVNFSDFRKLYYREMVARFGYLNAVTWNIGEGNGWDILGPGIGQGVTTQQQMDFSAYIDNLAYYNDFITVHNGPAGNTEIYDQLLGQNSFTGTSIQGQFTNKDISRTKVKQFIQNSANAGRKWVVNYDEDWTNGFIDPQTFRENVLWSTITSGGAGVEHYLPNGFDENLNDFRAYDEYYSQLGYANDLYNDNNIPFYEMYNQDELVTNGWCHGDDFDNFVIYVRAADIGKTTIDLLGSYSVKWFDPRTGGNLRDGSITNVEAGFGIDLGMPPSDGNLDWVIVVQNSSTSTMVTDVLIDPASIEIGTGDSFMITAHVIPGNALERGVTWSTSDPSVVTVDASGTILGVSAGMATITATSIDGGLTAETIVTVVNSGTFCTGSGTITMERYDNISGNNLDQLINALDYPDNPSEVIALTSFEIESDVLDNYGARISGYLCPPQTGLYTFWIAGDDHVELNLSTDDKEENVVTIAYHNTFTNSRQWDKVDSQRSIQIPLQQGNTYYIEALYKEGTFGDNLAVGWSKPFDGNAQLPTEIIPGNVLSPRNSLVAVTGIDLDPKEVELDLGETQMITATILPSDATIRNVTWTSSDESVVTVDAIGNISGLAVGTAIITATTVDGGFMAPTNVTVMDADAVRVTGVTLDPTETELELGSTLNLLLEVLPVDATNKDVVWASTDPTIVSVDSEGLVRGESVGTTVVSASTVDGSFVAEATITVFDGSVTNVTGIRFDLESLTLEMGEIYKLNPLILPANATNSEISWSSDDPEIVTIGNDGTVTGTSIGTTRVTVTSVDGGFTAEMLIEVVAEELLMVFPNPAEDYITVTGVNDLIFISVFTIHGKLLSTTKTNRGGTRIYVGNLATGTYLVGLEYGKKLRFIKR